MMHELSASDVHMWAVPLDEFAGPLTGLESLLSADERQQVGCFTRDDLLRRYVVSHAALRGILGSCLDRRPADVPFEIEKNGKPKLATAAANDLRFNLAHSGELALVAVTRGCEIGVDIEHRRPVRHLEELAQRYFAPTEIDAILTSRAVERDAAFLTTWTMKEAVLKGMGRGLGFALDRVVVDLAAPAQTVRVDEAPLSRTTEWWLQRIAGIGGYVAAVATSEERQPPLVIKFDPAELLNAV